MKTEASSTDNYDGCKHKLCKVAPGLGLLAVNGAFESCFLSLAQYRPWFVVHLNRYHPIVLIHVVTGKAVRTEEKFTVFVGNNSCIPLVFLFNLCLFRNILQQIEGIPDLSARGPLRKLLLCGAQGKSSCEYFHL